MAGHLHDDGGTYGNDEITFRGQSVHPLEYCPDQEPGDEAGGAGVGVVQKLPDRPGEVQTRLFPI